MKRIIMVMLVPPAAVAHYGISATWTTAPIAVFWMASLVGIAIGLVGGPFGAEGPAWPIVGLGLLMWAIAAMWAELVIKGVDDDLHHNPDSTLDHKIEPRPDEPDPFKELSRARDERSL